MKKAFILLPVLMISLMLSAQTQQGFVKTKGRMVNGKLIPGHGLKGATVSIKGRTAVLVKADDGAFSFPVTEVQFRVDSVRKKGYQLVDMEACPRTYKYSGNPIYIVMGTPDQQLQDKLNAERKIRRNLRKQLQEKEDEIEALKEQQKISDEEYRQTLQKLYQDQESNEQLISDMAKRYSELDYDQLDEFYRQVSYCIENGELVKADSLLKTKGDVTQQVEDQLRKGQAIQERENLLNQAKAVHVANLDELARRCYSYYETFAAQHLNDTAAYYLELRASLDTTNVEWLNEAGKFIKTYIGDYKKSLSIFEKALRTNLSNEGDDNSLVAESYSFIADIYYCQSKYDLALEYFTKSLLFESNIGLETANLATCYNNIGIVWFYLGDYSQALDYANKALRIRTKLFDLKNLDLANSYTLISYIYLKQDNYTESMALAEQALNIRVELLEPIHPDIASAYSNLAMVYLAQYNFQKALEYTKKSLDINIELFGKFHPQIAQGYNNLGAICLNMGDYNNAINYLNKAIEIRERVLGINHSETANTYNQLGRSYYCLKNYTEAIKYFDKSLKIREELFGMNHPDIAESYHNIGSIYFTIGENSKAQEYMLKALSLDKNIYGENSNNVAISYDHIGLTYLMEKDYSKAMEYCQHAITIKEELFGQEDPRTASSYTSLGVIYDRQKNYSKAIEYFEKALMIEEKHLGMNHYDTKLTKQYLEQTLLKQKSSDIEEMKKYVCIATTIEGDTPAKQQGMNGEYVILEVDDWSIDNVSSLFELNETRQKKPTTLLVLKDNTIYQYYFEDKIGINYNLKLVGTQEKEKIIELYNQWKSKKK